MERHVVKNSTQKINLPFQDKNLDFYKTFLLYKILCLNIFKNGLLLPI